MNTSTPKNSKLYDYLQGFELVCFTGSDLKYVERSVRLLFDDIIHALCLDIEPRELEKPLSHVSKFLRKYYDRMANIKNHIKVNELADNSKLSLKQLDEMVNRLMSCSLETVAFMTLNGEPFELCDKCPWYLNKKSCLIFCDEAEEEGILQSLTFPCADYRYLALAILELTKILVNYCDNDFSQLAKFYDLMSIIQIPGHIFELMNPSGEAREKYIQEVREELIKDPISYDTPEWLEYKKLFDSVCKDIIIGNKEYVKEFRTAMFSARRLMQAPYDKDLDPYCSMKSSGQRDFTKEEYSLVSSVFEVDIHKNDPRVKKWDELYQFNSTYRDIRPDDILAWCCKTICINNPGKYKPRIIHILDNALQDRCNKLHRCLKLLLKLFTPDSSGEQSYGREFLKSLTREWFLADSMLDRIGIYGTDFSNATDTADQRFTHMVLEFIFNDEGITADFWDYVSTMPRCLVHADGTKEEYTQTTGQPQGALGSFEIFSLVHIFLFLMDMKENGLEDVRSSEFFTVLGDDAIFNSVYPECNYYDPDDPIKDKEGFDRSILEYNHLRKCEHFAGFKINYDKCTSAHFNSPEAKLDFAKVTYRNGMLFTPIPFRLAMRYSKSFDDQLAVSLWEIERGGIKVASNLLDTQLSRLGSARSKYESIIKSGEIPFLDKFKDGSIQLSEPYKNLIRYSYAVSIIELALGLSLVNDRNRGKYDADPIDQAIRDLFTNPVQRLMMNDVDPNHKVWNIIYRNAELTETMHRIYENDHFDDQFMALCLSSIMRDKPEEIIWLIYEISAYRVQWSKVESSQLPSTLKAELLPTFGYTTREIRKEFSSVAQSLTKSFLLPGTTKRPREESYIFRKLSQIIDEHVAVLGNEQYGTDPV